MKTYIGIKAVQAKPAQRTEPASIYEPFGVVTRDGYQVRYADGYTSWSPKEAFEESYVEVPEKYAPGILSALHDELRDILVGEDAPLADERFEIRSIALRTAIDAHARQVIRTTVVRDQHGLVLETARSFEAYLAGDTMTKQAADVTSQISTLAFDHRSGDFKVPEAPPLRPSPGTGPDEQRYAGEPVEYEGEALPLGEQVKRHIERTHSEVSAVDDDDGPLGGIPLHSLESPEPPEPGAKDDL